METNEKDISSHKKIEALLKKNSDLIEENNKMLRKLNKITIATFWVRIVWYVMLIGLPFALYFLLEPYFEMFGSSYEEFQEGLNQLPGVKSIDAILEQNG
jgi:ferric iron reductase protein FhuF